jgi:stage V sporulation protein B
VSKDTFLRGAFILTAAGIIVKIIGSVNRIFLSRLLGGEGIGLYQMAYPIYLLALSVSSAGIPVAISIMVAERIALSDYRGANRIFRISLGVLIITGLLFSALLFWGSCLLIKYHFVRDSRAYYAIAALAPAIFFVTVLSSYRGYFQGLQMMLPTAVSQIAEQFVRVATMIILAIVLLPHGLEYAAAGASFGAAPGAAAGLIALIYYYVKHHHDLKKQMKKQDFARQEPIMSVILRIVKLALPVSLANIMIPVVSNIDLLIVPARLEVAGFSVEHSTELFGYLTGMAVALVNLPTILTASLAASLVPAVSEAFALGDCRKIQQRTEMAMRIANMITIPSFIGLCLLAAPISLMLYGTLGAGGCIAVLAGGIVLLGIHQVTTGVLQGLGHTTIPLINMIVSAGVKIIMSWFLTAIPSLGIIGAAWATVVDFGVAAVLNMYFVYRYVGLGINFHDTGKAFIAATIMGGVVLITYDQLMLLTRHNTLSTLAAICAGGVVYGIVLLGIGGVRARDVEKIPRVGFPLVQILRRMYLLRK